MPIANSCAHSDIGISISDKLTLSGQAVLAPMSGITDAGFRRIARRFGASMVVSEMVASENYARGDAETLLRAEGRGVSPHVVQLAGCQPYWMGEAAALAEGAGADMIDINMGCPAKRVTGGYAGSALMRDLDLASRLIEATVKAVNIPVSLKMRLGWDENSENAAELAQKAEALGIKLITVHGRFRQQFYKGQANWSAVAAVKRATTLPLIVNGDIEDAQTAREALAQSGADAVMLGRATLGQPWLVGAVNAALAQRDIDANPSHKADNHNAAHNIPDVQSRIDALIEHFEYLLSSMGARAGIRHYRKHLAAAILHFQREGYAQDVGQRNRILTSDNKSEIIQYLQSIG